MVRPYLGKILSPLLALPMLAACGADGSGDGGTAPPVGDSGCAPGTLASPDGSCQPAGLPPDMPCPPGQRALADGSCQPAGVPAEACAAGAFVPDGRGGCEATLPRDACAPGWMAVPGESACREVSPCGEGRWGELPVEPTTQYVDHAYSGGDSDGSQEKPWTTIQAGVDAAAAGAIVAVAEGRYEEDVLITSGPVRLWGRCPARTEVAGLNAQSGAIRVGRERTSGTEVRGLAVTGLGFGVLVQDARPVVLEALWIHDARRPGLVVQGSAAATVRGALVERSYQLGVYVYGAEATLEGTVVRATQPDGTGGFGFGISVQRDEETKVRGDLSLKGSLIEQNSDVGVAVFGSGAVVEATVVRATKPDAARRSGTGILVQPDPTTQERGELSLKASLVDQNRESGVFIAGSDATIEATVVRATQPESATGTSGRGIAVQPNPATAAVGKLSLTASLVEQNHEIGVLIHGSEATVESTIVRATQQDGSARAGWGVTVQQDRDTGGGGKLSLTASLIEENAEGGIGVEGSEATVESTVVRRTQPGAAGEYGIGIVVDGGASASARGVLSLKRSLVEENHYLGVFVQGAEATVEASVVRATQPNRVGRHGHGISVQASEDATVRGKLSLTTTLVEECYEGGVIVIGSDASIAATVVRATKQSADMAFGDGIMVLDSLGQSNATLSATASTDNARAGVLFVGSTGELTGTRSSGNRFGLVLQDGASGAQPTLGKGAVFEGNEERDRIVGGDFQVPEATPALP